MKSLYSIVVILAAIALIGSVGASLQQQASALNLDWKEFKMLTNEFEKAVKDAAAMGDTDEINRLATQYCDDVKMLFESPSPSP